MLRIYYPSLFAQQKDLAARYAYRLRSLPPTLHFCGNTLETYSVKLQKDMLNKKSRQLPTFPQKCSIIGVRELDFRVRYGNGYCLSTMATGIY